MNIGEKIKNLRLQNNLTLEELGDRCDLTKGFISQLERELTSPSIATLIDILDALGTNLQEFFEKKTKEQIVFKKTDVFTSDSLDNNCKITWLIKNAQKNQMEPILVSMKPNSVLFEDKAHIGEEFGYVLGGKVVVSVKKEEYTVRKGESFYYKSDSAHKVINPFDKEAKLIMVCTPPSF